MRAKVGLWVWFVVGILISGVAMSWFLAPEGQASPESPFTGRLAFGHDGPRNHGVFVVGADGTGLRKISHGVHVDGYHNDTYDPDWAPDGTRIAFVGTRNKVPGLFTVKPDGTSQKRLDRAHCYADYEPDWSPNSDRIIFRHDNCEWGTIRVRDRDGSNLRHPLHRIAFDPVWSPDGTQFAFTGLDNGYQVHVVDADGGNARKLTSAGDGGTESFRPSWSPDGRRVIFATSTAGDREVCVAHVPSTELGGTPTSECLTSASGNDYEASFSPDGKRIVFTSERRGNEDIFIMHADGSHKRALTHNPGNDHQPVWSRDGKAIAFVSKRKGQGVELYVMRPDGSSLSRVTHLEGRESTPAWR